MLGSDANEITAYTYLHFTTVCVLIDRHSTERAYCGLDYVFIEGEHFVHNIETVENQIRAIQVAGAVPIVRIPSHEDGLILQVIEAGVMGVIFPHIDTKEQALHAIREVKYPPVGNCGFGDSARASKFGFLPTEQFLDYVNENVMVIGMIESREGIRNLDEILSTGIDVLRIGAKDLSLDMGYGGVVTPEVKETVKEVCRRCGDLGKAAPPSARQRAATRCSPASRSRAPCSDSILNTYLSPTGSGGTSTDVPPLPVLLPSAMRCASIVAFPSQIAYTMGKAAFERLLLPQGIFLHR